jgi:hypothetical protein
MLLVLALAAPILAARACPVTATSALPEVAGRWEVRVINALDRPRPDTMLADATIAAELQDCLLRERLVARGGAPGYEALIHWGANGADSTIQRTFVHSNHGRLASTRAAAPGATSRCGRCRSRGNRMRPWWSTASRSSAAIGSRSRAGSRTTPAGRGRRSRGGSTPAKTPSAQRRSAVPPPSATYSETRFSALARRSRSSACSDANRLRSASSTSM